MPSIVWKGHLTFGLVSIPVKLFRAARRERVRMHYVHRPATEERYVEPSEEEAEEPVPNPPLPIRPRRPEAATAEPDIAEPPSFATPPPVSRVRQSLVSSEGDQPVRRADLLKGYEIEPDRYVVLDPNELKSLQRRTSPNMEIVRSVKLSEIDPVFFETSYYVVPDRGGEKAYAILFKALRETGHVALARVGMHGREHVVIVRPG